MRGSISFGVGVRQVLGAVGAVVFAEEARQVRPPPPGDRDHRRAWSAWRVWVRFRPPFGTAGRCRGVVAVAPVVAPHRRSGAGARPVSGNPEAGQLVIDRPVGGDVGVPDPLVEALGVALQQPRLGLELEVEAGPDLEYSGWPTFSRPRRSVSGAWRSPPFDAFVVTFEDGQR